MNAKSITASSHGLPVDRRVADHHRVGEAGLQLGLGEPLAVGPQVEEPERVVGAQLRGLLDERAGVGEPARSARGRGIAEVVAALAADAERRASSSSR